MTEFRAKLRLPKREYVLGAVISDVEPRVSSRGIGYANIRFANYPLISNFNQFEAVQVNRAFTERGLYFSEEHVLPQAGDVVHLDVRWVEHNKKVYPQARIDLRAFVEALLYFAYPAPKGGAK